MLFGVAKSGFSERKLRPIISRYYLTVSDLVEVLHVGKCSLRYRDYERSLIVTVVVIFKYRYALIVRIDRIPIITLLFLAVNFATMKWSSEESVITHGRSRREGFSSETSPRRNSGERVFLGDTPPCLKPPRMVGVRSSRKGRDRRDRNKSAFWARQTGYYQRHSPKGRQASSSSSDSNFEFLQEDYLFESNDDESSEKKNQHDIQSRRATRRRRCSRGGSNKGNSDSPHNMKRHSPSAREETKWIIGHRLVRSICAALETTSGENSPEGPRERGWADTDLFPSTEPSTPHPGHDLAQAGDARKSSLESSMEFGTLNDCVLKPVVCADEAGHNAEDAGGIASAAKSPPLPDRLVHDHCTICLGNDPKHGARGETNKNAKAAPIRTRRSRRAVHCHAPGCGCGLLLADGCRDLTKVEVLVAQQILLAVRETVREGTRCSRNRDSPQCSGRYMDQEAAARDAENLGLAKGHQQAVENKHIATLRDEEGDEDRENNEGTRCAAKHVEVCRGAGAGAAPSHIGAEGHMASPDVLETENARPRSPGDVQEELHTPRQPICTDSEPGEAPGPTGRPSPKKTIAQQVDEVSARLNRIFVLPLI